MTTTEQKLTLAREALEDIKNPIEAMRRDVPEGYRFEGGMALHMANDPQWYKRRAEKALEAIATESAPAAQTASIDTPQFHELLLRWEVSRAPESTAALQALIAHINAFAAQQREEGRRDCWPLGGTNEALRERAEKAEAALAQRAAGETNSPHDICRASERQLRDTILTLQEQLAERAAAPAQAVDALHSAHARIRALESAGMQLAAQLARMPVESSSKTRNVDYLCRQTVMDHVFAWRKAFDDAPKFDARAALAVQPAAPAEAADNFVPEHWRDKARHIVSGKMNIAESSAQAIMLLRVMLAAPVANAGQAQSFDAVWDALDWDKWRSEPIRELVRHIYTLTTPSVRQAQTVAVNGVRWDLFPGYLIDNCEGDMISEEQLQGAVAAMLKHPDYLVACADTGKDAVEIADAVRLTLANVYKDKLNTGTSEMGGNMDWARLEGAAEVVAALRLAAAPLPRQVAQNAKFQIGDHVRKTKGSRRQGHVVGTYSTSLTPEGYAVESSTEHGSVQIYPAAALELVEKKP